MLRVFYFMVAVREQGTLQISFHGMRELNSSDCPFANSVFRHWP